MYEKSGCEISAGRETLVRLYVAATLCDLCMRMFRLRALFLLQDLKFHFSVEV
jgi:hypothetical protein